MTAPRTYPFKPGDWVADPNDYVARVRAVYSDPVTGQEHKTLLDLVLYGRDGSKIGRESPGLGGPRGFEPACCSENWRRIRKPDFPMQVKLVPDPGRPGISVARYWAGETLPPANWTPKPRKPAFRLPPDDRFRRAIEKIADGHNDARGLALETLGRK